MPVRNGLAYTRAALPTLLAQDIGDVDLLMIDNDSTDGTGEFCRAQQGVLYHHQRPALSVAASWNKGLRFLFEDDGAPGYVLTVNNDLLLKPETYRLLVEDGGQFVTGVGVNTMEQFAELCAPSQRRPHPDFSCFLIRRECWDRVGPFDEQFVGAYAEDSDYHLRMHQAGISAYCLDLPFYHAASGTIKSASEKEAEAIRRRADANRERFKAKWGVEAGSTEYYTLFTARP